MTFLIEMGLSRVTSRLQLLHFWLQKIKVAEIVAELQPKSVAGVKIVAGDQIDSLFAYIHIICQTKAFCMEIRLLKKL